MRISLYLLLFLALSSTIAIFLLWESALMKSARFGFEIYRIKVPFENYEYRRNTMPLGDLVDKLDLRDAGVQIKFSDQSLKNLRCPVGTHYYYEGGEANLGYFLTAIIDDYGVLYKCNHEREVEIYNP